MGDVLNSGDELIFPNNYAGISCIKPNTGRFDIKGQSIKANIKGELLAILKLNLVCASDNYPSSISTLIFDGHDPSTYFTSLKTNGRILLIQDEPLAIKPAYKLDEKNFFFVQYNYNGRIVIRKIPHNENSLVFSDKVFISVPGSMIDKVNLYYQSNASGSSRSTLIANFLPAIASKIKIQEQIDLISKHMDKTDKNKLKTEISHHLFDNYGKIGDEELTKLFGL